MTTYKTARHAAKRQSGAILELLMRLVVDPQPAEAGAAGRPLDRYTVMGAVTGILFSLVVKPRA
jgi:hypothetical protein